MVSNLFHPTFAPLPCFQRPFSRPAPGGIRRFRIRFWGAFVPVNHAQKRANIGIILQTNKLMHCFSAFSCCFFVKRCTVRLRKKSETHLSVDSEYAQSRAAQATPMPYIFRTRDSDPEQFTKSIPSVNRPTYREVTACDGTFPDTATYLMERDTPISFNSFLALFSGRFSRVFSARSSPSATDVKNALNGSFKEKSPGFQTLRSVKQGVMKLRGVRPQNKDRRFGFSN